MVAVSLKKPILWRGLSLLLIISMGAYIASSVSWVLKDRNLAGSYLQPFDSLFTICALIFIPLINYCFSRELLVRTTHERTEQNKQVDEVVLTLVEKITGALEQVSLAESTSIHSDDKLVAAVVSTLSQTMEDVKKRYSAIQKVRVWLGDKIFLKELSVKATNSVLNHQNSSLLKRLTQKLNPSLIEKRRQSYQEVYDCLTWVKKSFYIGDFTSSNKLLSERIKHPGLVVDALQWIKQEFLEKELQVDSRQELDIYFDELIHRIGQISASN